VTQAWRLAAVSERCLRQLQAARNGETLPEAKLPRTARNLARGGFSALATVGRAVARGVNAAAALVKARAAAAAARLARAAARAVRAALRRALAEVAKLLRTVAAPAVVASSVGATTATTRSLGTSVAAFVALCLGLWSSLGQVVAS
jgi:hypothetical protein